ncbi:diacylglycerol/lipid kinase family protein [Microbacterium neungamense]|uniref:diacylglycerol/lipid kinase family protein n=1 Tax=Microbacterium neungamense TaxID=2810535 RepID=UPI00217E67B5|nr:diacylglycerol kinase family protein [Microbacterium neungamense]UWF78542.1 NAD(+)/NADH kinase [Microbacterium neungamense]
MAETTEARRSAAVIWNPSKVDEDELRTAVDAALGEDVLWLETSEEDPGRGMAEQAIAEGRDLLIAVGGDGTVRAVAEAVAGTEAALGIVPRGTGNLLARNLGIPLGDIPAALARISAGEERPLDLGWVTLGEDAEEQAFAVMIGFGLDAQMLAETDDDLKAKAGWLAYVQALGRAAAATELVGAQIALDDEEPEATSIHTMLIGNCGTIQGGITLLPDAKPDDGRLDVLLVSADDVAGWIDTARSVLWDNGLKRLLQRSVDVSAVSTDSATHASAERIRVKLLEPQPFEIDGEEAGEVSEFSVRVQKGALRVL